MTGNGGVDGRHALPNQPSLRRHNLSAVLRHLVTDGPRSRARLAQATGLTKATVSSLVGELAERGLVREGSVERGAVGRPGQQVALNGPVACGVGVELNVDYVASVVVDLAGQVISAEHRPLPASRLGSDVVLDEVARATERALAVVAAVSSYPAGVTLALPGGVDVAAGILTYAPNLGWRDVPVVAALESRLGDVGLHVDNEANLAALGEYGVGAAAGTRDLLLLTGEVGVGGGIISGGRLLRGGRGHAGEVGHMQLDPQGRQCGCGRRGCWETVVGLWPLLHAVAGPGDTVLYPTVGLEERLTAVSRRAEAQDARTLVALEQVGSWLGLGASLLVNVLNPTVLVLGGYFATLGPWLLEPVRRQLAERVVAPAAGGCRVELSTLGFTAAVRGGAQVALDAVLEDPTIVDRPVPSHPVPITTAGA